MTENSFIITGDWPMRAGVLELFVPGLSSASEAIGPDGEWLLVWLFVGLFDQPSIAMGVARGIK
jgi:hypothetical protein